MRTTLARSLFAFVPASVLVAACSSTTEKSQSLRQVDDLISHVERMQVESLVGKEKARAALTELQTLTAPDFQGDPRQTYAQFVAAIEQSEAQARTISTNIVPMKETAETMFQQWTEDLESFGNSRMRARSAMRLEETRTRYQAVLSSATAVQVAYDAFNSDLRDHALFLGHDFNTSAVQSITADVAAMKDQVGDLDARFEACVQAARNYVEAGALHGQIEGDGTTAQPAPAPTETRTTTTRKRRMTTLAPTTDATTTTPTATGTTTTTPDTNPTPGTSPAGTPPQQGTTQSGTTPQHQG
jgi:hypothetical protein